MCFVNLPFVRLQMFLLM